MVDRPIDIIRSSENRTIKLIRSLHQRDRREQERAFVVEGVRAVEDALLSGAEPQILLVREDTRTLMEQPPFSELSRARWRIVDAALFNTLAETVTPQGLIGLFSFPELAIPATPASLVLVLDQLRDPGNMGTLLRSAVGAGATCIVLTPGCVDPFNAKVVRAGMGAHFRIPIRWLDDEVAAWLRETCPARVLAESGDHTVYHRFPWNQGVALIIGSEAIGATTETSQLVTERVAIPLQGNLESLNAAVAGSVILFEIARQRSEMQDSAS